MFAVQSASRISLNNCRRYAHSLPELSYTYAALEPVISKEIMELHHTKHHMTYVNNLNVAEEKLKECISKCDISGAIALVPALRFNGGGHLNHSIFWQNLSPECSRRSDAFDEAICNDFGDIEKLQHRLSTATVAIQGSGWGWLGYNKATRRMEIATCANQDPLEATTGLVPLLGIDVWEHAYYLQYKNVRADYVKKIFDIINWKDVSERYEKANSSKKCT